MDFRVLGPVEVWEADRALALGGSKRRTLLALLVLNANEVVSTDRLAEELWGSNTPANAAGSIQNHVSRLRKELGPEVLATHRWGYALRAAPESIDLCRFERAVAEAEALPAAERAARLAEALAMWRGPALADLAFEPALVGHVATLEERRLVTLEQRIDADLEAGRDTELVPDLEALVAANPLREHFRWQLILALYRSGRQAEALEVYRETRRLLADELGLEPGPKLRELERAVLRQDPSLTAPSAAAAEPGVPERTQRARRRAQAAIAATAVVAVLGSGGYALSRAWQSSPEPQVAAAAHPPAAPASHRAAAEHPRRASPRTRPRHSSAKRSSPRPAAVVSTRPRAAPPPPPQKTTTAARPATTTVVETRARAAPTRKKPPPGPPTTTATPQPTTPAPAATPPTLADSRAWSKGTNDTQIAMTLTDGAFTVVVPASARDDFNATVQTRCRAVGDFDARVRFELTQWPGADGAYVSLMASDLGGVNTYRTDTFGETYGTYIPTAGGTSVHATGSSGALRLTRVGNQITGSYDSGGSWVTIFSGPGPTAPTAINLSVFNLANVATFAGRPLSVRFDSFSLDAPTLAC